MLVHIIHRAAVAAGSAWLVSGVKRRSRSPLIEYPRGRADAVGMS